jgi:hypothetical protein
MATAEDPTTRAVELEGDERHERPAETDASGGALLQPAAGGGLPAGAGVEQPAAGGGLPAGAGVEQPAAGGEQPAGAAIAAPRDVPPHPPLLGRRAAWVGLGLVLAFGLGLRLWGIRQGLPYSYNSDEDAHFVPHAIGIFSLGANPHYFANPPAYTYLLYLVFALSFGGAHGVFHTFATDPTAVFTLARVVAALLGTLALYLLYLAGARLFDRATALLAVAIGAVAFLPVFYAHLALNDVPTLAPLTLSLLGSARILRGGRSGSYLLAGLGLGLGCATKYTAGIVLLPLLAAAAAQYLDEPRAGPRILGRLVLAGATALLAFLLANPYSLLDFHSFERGLAHQSSVSGEAQGKLGAPHESGIRYYLWSLTWGLGWIPAIAALGGALTVWFRERALGWLLVPAPLLYLAFMGTQHRYFGRWLLPIFPLLCLLAAFFALRCATLLAAGLAQAFSRRGTGRPAPSPACGGPAARMRTKAPPPRTLTLLCSLLLALVLCAQGAVHSIHSGLVLSRADTRNLARAWLVAHVPAGARVVIDPSVPAEWAQDVGRPTLSTPGGDRWIPYSDLVSLIDSAGRVHPDQHTVVGIENYERTLSPALIPWYEHNDFCWVVSGFAESGRAFADPAAVPLALAYYHALARAGRVLYSISPYSPRAHPIAFNFDWTFDYYPLAYTRPGPAITVYRLDGGRCA